MVEVVLEKNKVNVQLNNIMEIRKDCIIVYVAGVEYNNNNVDTSRGEDRKRIDDGGKNF